jgi:CRISPR-associated protein Cas2
MRRNRYLVAYDIREPKRLRRVFKTMKGYGTWVQYSVFVCDLSMAELCSMKSDLREIMEYAVDSVMVVPLGEGYDPTCIEFLGVSSRLPTGGATVI